MLTSCKSNRSELIEKPQPQLSPKGTKCRNPASKGGSATRAMKPKLWAKSKASALQSLINEAQLGEGEEGDPDLI